MCVEPAWRLPIRRWALWLLALGLVASGSIAGAFAQTPQVSQDVTNYHNDPGRSGMYVVPGLTWATAPSAHMVAGWKGGVQGAVWVQPLYWRAPGAPNGMIIVGTDRDVVQALDSVTGETVWTANLGPNVASLPPPCPSSKPQGITGTPVIDAAAGAIYLDVLQSAAIGPPQHLIYGLSLTNGAVLPGWPQNVQNLLAANGMAFSSPGQGQHGALALVNGNLYVAFGGPGADCGSYHGWVVGLNVATPGLVEAWRTRAEWGGVWSRGGVTYDGTSLFITTGNTKKAKAWADGEAVIRLRPDLQHSADRRDFFTPTDWRTLDADDLDVGSTGPLPIDVPIAGGGTAAWLLALGKPGDAYLLDRANLNGLSGPLLTQSVAASHIDTAGAAYQAGGGVYVAIQAAGTACPPPAANIALTVLAITAQPAPSITTAWCASLASTGVPIVTTSDGVADPVVWIVGSEGDALLHGYRGDTGQVLFSGAPMTRLRRFVVPVAAEGRLYVAADERIFAFAFGANALH